MISTDRRKRSEKYGNHRLQLSNWLIFQITALGLLMAMGGMGSSISADLSEQNTASVIISTDNLTVKEYVNKYFSDIPVMAEVARCESQFRQHGKDGRVLSGVVNSSDKGVMQINEYYHLDKAQKLGLDLKTIEGNTAYARYLFETKGLQPWISSSKCWKKTAAYADYRTELALNSTK